MYFLINNVWNCELNFAYWLIFLHFVYLQSFSYCDGEFFFMILLTKASFFSLHVYMLIYICIISFRAKFFKRCIDFLNVELWCNTECLHWCFIFLINFYWNTVIAQCCTSLHSIASCPHPLVFGFPSHSGHHRALRRVLECWQLTYCSCKLTHASRGIV